MELSVVAAVARNRVIGADGDLPWHLPADLQHFRKLTLGKALLMGRATHHSIGRPLPERHNIVLSSNPALQAPGCTVVQSVEEAIAAAGDATELMIIGGESLYRSLLPRADRLYLTEVDATVSGDRYFPTYDPAEWQELSRVRFSADSKNRYDYCFVELKRLIPAASAAPATASHQ